MNAELVEEYFDKKKISQRNLIERLHSDENKNKLLRKDYGTMKSFTCLTDKINTTSKTNMKNQRFEEKEISDQILNISLNEYQDMGFIKNFNDNNLKRLIRVREIFKNFTNNQDYMYTQRKEIESILGEKLRDSQSLTKYKIYFPNPSFLKTKFKQTTVKKYKEIEADFF